MRGLFFASIHSAHWLFDVLHGAYDNHMERAQMRLAPVKPRSWRGIARAGARRHESGLNFPSQCFPSR